MSVYSNLVIADGASSYWRLNEPSGTTAVDVIGGKNGTISGGVTLNQQGALGDGDPSMAFNGTTGQIVTAATVTMATACSLEVWLRKSPGGTDLTFFSNRSTGLTSQILAMVSTAGCPYLFVNFQGGVGPGLKSIADNQWHHFVGVLTGSTGLLYIDGVLDFQEPRTHVASAAASVGIGIDNGPGSPPYAGLIDDVAIYPVALTPAQIAAHYQARLLSGSRRPLPAFVLAHRRFPS